MICLKLWGRCISLLDCIQRRLVYAVSDGFGRLIVKQILVAAIWGKLPQFLITMVILFSCEQHLATSVLLARSRLLLQLLLCHDVWLSCVVVFKDQLGAALDWLFSVCSRRRLYHGYNSRRLNSHRPILSVETSSGSLSHLLIREFCLEV